MAGASGRCTRHSTRALVSLAGAFVVLTASAVSDGAPAKVSAPDPEAALPPPQVTLTVTPGSGGSPWRLQIENKGEGPVRIPADPRLLILELTPANAAEPEEAEKKNAKKKAPVLAAPRCSLPDDARPSTDDGRDLVIPASRTWSATFDPLFYCFGARERAALVPGTTVKARFGWPTPPARAGVKTRPLGPPFAVAPVGASVSKVSPAKAIEADPFALTEAVTVAKPATANDEAPVALSVPDTLDVARGTEVPTTVTLSNVSDRPVTVLFRPDMIQFTVSGPGGNTTCGGPRTVAAPIRELFSTVPVKGKTQVSVLATTTCPTDTFDQAGVYRIVPKLDTTNASGRTIGLKSWEGVAVGKTPLLVRVRSPRKSELSRPILD